MILRKSNQIKLFTELTYYTSGLDSLVDDVPSLSHDLTSTGLDSTRAVSSIRGRTSECSTPHSLEWDFKGSSLSLQQVVAGSEELLLEIEELSRELRERQEVADNQEQLSIRQINDKELAEDSTANQNPRKQSSEKASSYTNVGTFTTDVQLLTDNDTDDHFKIEQNECNILTESR